MTELWELAARKEAGGLTDDRFEELNREVIERHEAQLPPMTRLRAKRIRAAERQLPPWLREKLAPPTDPLAP